MGRAGIVSFPNLPTGRRDPSSSCGGRMPVSRDLPYQWWDTPNIHLCTVNDFRELCRQEGLRIEREFYLRSIDAPPPAGLPRPNLTARLAIFAVSRRV